MDQRLYRSACLITGIEIRIEEEYLFQGDEVLGFVLLGFRYHSIYPNECLIESAIIRMMLLQCKTVWDAAVSTLRFVTRSIPHKKGYDSS